VVTGMGGVQHWIIYQGVGNPTGSVPYSLTLACRDPGNDDSAFTLGVTYVHAPFPDVPMCYGTGYTLPVVDHIDLIVTCDAAVPTASDSWGAVKAAFR
jgi:hypothetical protein